MVAHLDWPHLQNLAGIMESRKPRAKHRADFARSRLALEMDRVAPRGDRRVHDVLSPALPETNRGRTDSAFGSRTAKPPAGTDWRSSSNWTLKCSDGIRRVDDESKIQEFRSVKRGPLDGMWFGKKSRLDWSHGAVESVGLVHGRAGEALELRVSHGG